MAAGARFDDMFIEYAAAWAEVEDRYPDYVGARSAAWAGAPYPSDVASMISGVARSAASAMPGYLVLMNVCDRGKYPDAGAQRLQRCAAVGRLMLGKGSSVLTRGIGFALIRRSGEPTVQDRAANRAFRWTMAQSIRAEQDKPDTLRAYFSDLFATGDELAAMQRQVARN